MSTSALGRSSATSSTAGCESTIARVQALSGLVFGVFLLLHLGNLAVAALGQQPYDAVHPAAPA